MASFAVESVVLPINGQRYTRGERERERSMEQERRKKEKTMYLWNYIYIYIYGEFFMENGEKIKICKFCREERREEEGYLNASIIVGSFRVYGTKCFVNTRL